MGTAEKFCLRWNDFESNISGAFRELREDKDFFDVTLACDDDQIQAHKVILSACSPFFRTILRRNQHSHPLLYLKGVKYADLLAVLNFMYHGEVNVAQEELNSFLAVAEDLKVKGLTQNGSDPTKMTNVPKEISRKTPNHNYPDKPPILPPPKRPRPSPPSVPRVIPTTYQADHEEIQEIVPVKSEPAAPVEDQAYSVESVDTPTENMEEYDDYSGYQEDAGYEETGQGYTGYSQQMGQTGTTDLDDVIMGHMSKTKNEFGKTEWMCNICGKRGVYKRAIKCHVETHLEGVEQHCPYCEKKPKTREALRVHIMDYHKKA